MTQNLRPTGMLLGDGARELTAEELALVAGGGWVDVLREVGESAIAGEAVAYAKRYAGTAVRFVAHEVADGARFVAHEVADGAHFVAHEAGAVWNKVRNFF